MDKTVSVLEKIFIGTLLLIFGGIVLHAPLSVGFSTLFPAYELPIKSWKEILLGVALLAAVVIVTIKRKWNLLQTTLLQYILLFAALNLFLISVFYTGFDASVAGLFINLRYFLFFVLVYVALQLFPKYYQLFIKVFIGGALVVVGFALLQLTVLPTDVLKYIGYNESTIMPYLTVDQNEAYVRINSTLRGPNPLGIFAVITLAVTIAAWVKRPRTLSRREQVVMGILAAGSLAALVASFSRSAALAAVIAVGLVLMVVYGRRISKKVLLAVGIVAIVLAGSLVAFKDTQFVSQVILHEDPLEGNSINSNDGHADSLAEGTRRLAAQPLGAGIGSTGSASLLTDSPIIIENQYLFVAHEVGWPGLALFLMINYVVLKELWRRRTQWLALGVFASGVGIAVAGIFLPVWADDTVSIIWWGLAAIALAIPVAASKKKRVKKK